MNKTININIDHFSLLFHFTLESPRWLIARGRVAEANQILHKFAARNKSRYPEDEVNVALDEEEKFTIKQVLTSKTIYLRMLNLALGWWSVNFVFTGLTMNVTNISGDLYLNMFILYLVEQPGNLLCMKLIDTRLGRRLTNCLSISIAGIALLCVAAVPEGKSKTLL